jgi:hypothetical protein
MRVLDGKVNGYKMWSGDLKGRDHLQVLGVDGRITWKLSCDSTWSGRSLLTFRRNVLPPYSGPSRQNSGLSAHHYVLQYHSLALLTVKHLRTTKYATVLFESKTEYHCHFSKHYNYLWGLYVTLCFYSPFGTSSALCISTCFLLNRHVLHLLTALGVFSENILIEYFIKWGTR